MNLLAFAAMLAVAATPALADGLVENANGYTLDAKGRMIRFTGLLIAKDGTVSKLLDKDDKRPKQPDFRLDAKGRTLIPGLIDPGTHLMQTALGGLYTTRTGSCPEAGDREGSAPHLGVRNSRSGASRGPSSHRRF